MLKHDKKRKSKDISLENFYNYDICIKITNRKDYDFTVLTKDELALLLEAADKYLGNMTKTLVEKYRRLRKEDLNCICLILLNINIGRLHHLLGRNRKTIWERMNRIKSIMNIKENNDLFLSIKDMLIK